MQDFLFYVALSMLLAHELDAVIQREWRLLFVLRRLPESVAAPAFVLLHIPLLAAILWLTSSADDSTRFIARSILDVFLVAHAFLHWRLRAHPFYTFHSVASRGLIFGAAAMGITHFLFTISTEPLVNAAGR